jgi:hypothetical protein
VAELKPLKVRFADLLAEGEFERASDIQEQMILTAILTRETERRPNRLQRWIEGQPIERGHMRRIAILATALFVLMMALAVTLGGGVFGAVAGQGSAVNGGLYLFNRFTGDAYWCFTNGTCRSLKGS